MLVVDPRALEKVKNAALSLQVHGIIDGDGYKTIVEAAKKGENLPLRIMNNIQVNNLVAGWASLLLLIGFFLSIAYIEIKLI